MTAFDEIEALERAEHGASEQSSGPGVGTLACPLNNAPAVAGPKPAFSHKRPRISIVDADGKPLLCDGKENGQ